MAPFLIPDDFRAFMKRVVRDLDAPGDAPKLLDGLDEYALRDETGHGGRIDGDAFRFTYLSPDGSGKWTVQLTEAAIRDIADGLLIEVMGERRELARTAPRPSKGQPLLIWGEYADDALVVRDRIDLIEALDALHALAQAGPRMLRMWSAADDQLAAVMRGDDCALYILESQHGYATSCGDASRTDSFELPDPAGGRLAVPYQDCVPWSIARNALLWFAERGDLGPEIRVEGRIPTGLLMMGDADRAAVLAGRAAPPRRVSRSSIRRPRTVSDEAIRPDTQHDPTLDEPLPAAAPLKVEELSAWARRLLELLHSRELIELGRVSLDEISYQLGGLLQAHGEEAQRSLDTAEWLANEIGAMRGIDKMFATGGDLQIALRRSRTG